MNIIALMIMYVKCSLIQSEQSENVLYLEKVTIKGIVLFISCKHQDTHTHTLLLLSALMELGPFLTLTSR